MLWIGRSSVLATLVTASAFVLGGCESGSSTSKDSSPASSRPVVRASAAENVISGSSASQLNFFDDLEIRPLAAQDDAVHAILLLGTGKSGENYEHRVLLAKRLKYLPSSFDRPGRQAVTVGEVAVMLSAVVEPAKPRTQVQAVEWLKSTGVLTQKLPVYQGLTGAQLVSLVGGVQDQLLSIGIKRSELPQIAVPATTVTSRSGSTRSVEPLPELAAAPIESAAPAATAAGAAARAKARGEPLPTLPPGAKAPVVELDPGALKPAAVGPDGKIVPAKIAAPGPNSPAPQTSPK